MIEQMRASVTLPPQTPAGAQFLVGQDERGRWLALDTRRLGGGVFRTRSDAIHFAAFETGHRPGGFALATTPLTLPF
jgi:hypothetical protein